MKDIVLITNYWHFEKEKASSRYLTLAHLIVENQMNLEVVTSSFYHANKKQREYSEEYLCSFPYKVTLIKEPGYKKNISIMRILSHKIFAENVLRFMKNRKTPDIIYCVVPSLDVADIITKYAYENGIKIIIDIQDLWPEAFKMAVNLPVISDLLFYPLKRKAERIYTFADKIIAVSNTYLERALSLNKKTTEGLNVYIGIELQKFDIYATEADSKIKPNNEIWIVYIGTLGYSYDLISVIDSIDLLRKKGYENLNFIVIGDGPRLNEFKKHAINKKINSKFLGKLQYSEMVKILKVCDIAVNPIVKNSAASIINKHADYFAAGLPIVNTQESYEFKKLLVEYGAGYSSENGNVEDLADKLSILIDDRNIREEMGRNSRKLAADKFDRNKTYNRIIELLKNT